MICFYYIIPARGETRDEVMIGSVETYFYYIMLFLLYYDIYLVYYRIFIVPL